MIHIKESECSPQPNLKIECNFKLHKFRSALHPVLIKCLIQLVHQVIHSVLHYGVIAVVLCIATKQGIAELKI